MVYFGNKKASGNIEALRQEIETLKQALNNYAKKNTTNAFTQQQDFQTIKIGSHYYFDPESNALRIRPNANSKWLYFGSPNSNYFTGIDLNDKVQLQGIKTPTANNHATNKEYVDTQLNNKIKYVEKVGGLTFTKDNDIISGKLCKYWARVNYSDLGIPNGKTIISCNIAKPADSKSISLSFFPKNTQNQCLIEIFQYNETSNIANALGGLTYCFTYIN